MKRERENGVSCLCICEEDMLREGDSRAVQNIHYIGSNIILLHLLCLGEEDARIYILLQYSNSKQWREEFVSNKCLSMKENVA